MVSGSCLCGEIEYEVELIPGQVYNCHCSLCRKAHGATFATQALARGETLTIKKGAELLGEYQGVRGIRAFCTNCGARLMNYARDKSLFLSVALASIDGDHNIKPVAHAYVDSKASWHNPSDDIPSYPGLPDGVVD